MPRYLVSAVVLFVLEAGLAFAFLGRSGAATYQTVTVQDLAGASEENRIVLDVREPWEFAEGHVAGATLIPLGQIEARATELPKDAPIYVICRSGNRAVAASEALVAAGFGDVRNVESGMLAWQAAGFSVTR